MQPYERQPADVVKSVQQRWLLMQWRRLCNGSPMPSSAGFDLREIESCRDDLSIFDVLPHNGVHRFRIVDHGRNIGTMFASSCAGKYLHELLPEVALAPTLETYEHVVRTARPVYTVSGMTDASGRPIQYERLLLPLGEGARVVRILALLETISTEGTIERLALLSDPQSTQRYAVKAELHLP